MGEQDIVARIIESAEYGYIPNKDRKALLDAAAEIERLRAELAGRDAEIAAWLRNEDNAGDWPRQWGVNRIEQIATAIAAGHYVENRSL